MSTTMTERIDADQLREDIIRKTWDDESFRQRLLAEPKQTIRDAFGIEIPEGHELLVVEETPTRHVLTIPPRPEDVSAIVARPAGYWW
ncbi:MAG: NHLP leader peptide family natural product precursor [Thermobacillus sp.]|uniref:NHLP leader peptide family RiPP precursor n=1 Tax=Thermobacillus sp. TaxID=2108467 RepID=UPI000E367A9B|nr:NHLP leader peptide family RiPP precursor [Thermobacillus sp.]REK52180.1 MAG: NHLP leader peptide family natural product precursor [Thermobacillus sp.]